MMTGQPANTFSAKELDMIIHKLTSYVHGNYAIIRRKHEPAAVSAVRCVFNAMAFGKKRLADAAAAHGIAVKGWHDTLEQIVAATEARGSNAAFLLKQTIASTREIDKAMQAQSFKTPLDKIRFVKNYAFAPSANYLDMLVENLTEYVQHRFATVQKARKTGSQITLHPAPSVVYVHDGATHSKKPLQQAAAAYGLTVAGWRETLAQIVAATEARGSKAADSLKDILATSADIDRKMAANDITAPAAKIRFLKGYKPNP